MKTLLLCSLAVAGFSVALAQTATKPVPAASTPLKPADSRLDTLKAEAENLNLAEAARKRRDAERSGALPDAEKLRLEKLLGEIDKSGTNQEKQAKLARLMETASPEARSYLQSKTDSKKAAIPATTKSATPPKAGPISFENVPVPPPKAPNPNAPKRKPRAPLVIDSNELMFDEKSRVATFTGAVKFRSITMDIDCSQMRVWFKEKAFEKEEQAPINVPLPPGAVREGDPPPGTLFDPQQPTTTNSGPNAPPPAPISKQSDDSKIEKAVADGRGSMVTIVRRQGDGVIVAKAGYAEFDDKTGDLTLRYRPEVQKGLKAQVGEMDTIMIIPKEGPARVIGASSTKILPEEAGKPKAEKPAAPKPAVPKTATP